MIEYLLISNLVQWIAIVWLVSCVIEGKHVVNYNAKLLEDIVNKPKNK